MTERRSALLAQSILAAMLTVAAGLMWIFTQESFTLFPLAAAVAHQAYRWGRLDELSEHESVDSD